MTREQELERQLADWLEIGPNTAPAEVVDLALLRTTGRRQRRGMWRVLAVPLERTGGWPSRHHLARVGALAAVLAGVLLTSTIVTEPLGGGPAPTPTPGPPPLMEAGVVQTVVGTAEMATLSRSAVDQVRTIELDTSDPRIDGRARQELTVLTQREDGAMWHGTMHLQNPWGTWDGPVYVVRYPSSEEYEYASLQGSGTYEGFTYLYTVRQDTAEAERTVEGAIWPDEPPPLPDPSLLP